jgi:hypothetical protein
MRGIEYYHLKDLKVSCVPQGGIVGSLTEQGLALSNRSIKNIKRRLKNKSSIAVYAGLVMISLDFPKPSLIFL